MPAALAGLARMLGAAGIGKAAAGMKANPTGFFVRTAKVGYGGSVGTIVFLWYTGWRRERVKPGTGQFPFPGLSKLVKQFGPSLPDEAFPDDIQGVGTPGSSAAKSGSQKQALDPGTSGVGTAPGQTTKTKHEPFDPIRYQKRYHTATKIANQFKLKITSAHRTAQHNAEVNGVPDSLHIDGLAFDMVGSVADMSRALRFGQDHPELFSEVMVHNVGSGFHVHLAFWPGAGL